LARVFVENLVKRFGSVIAVNNLSLEVKDKEFVVLLGPSGCGKTTTLRCIAGLETPDSGNIYIGDALVNDLPPKDRDIAMVFQSYALYPHILIKAISPSTLWLKIGDKAYINFNKEKMHIFNKKPSTQ
jgi:multiple sugar transport system ATP-binding protein